MGSKKEEEEKKKKILAGLTGAYGAAVIGSNLAARGARRKKARLKRYKARGYPSKPTPKSHRVTDKPIKLKKTFSGKTFKTSLAGKSNRAKRMLSSSLARKSGKVALMAGAGYLALKAIKAIKGKKGKWITSKGRKFFIKG